MTGDYPDPRAVALLGETTLYLDLNPVGKVTDFNLRPVRKSFKMVYPGGEYCLFEADYLNAGVVGPAGEMEVGLSGVEVIEVGNLFDRQAADECGWGAFLCRFQR